MEPRHRRLRRALSVALGLAVTGTLVSLPSSSGAGTVTPYGSEGIGDSYFPEDGNGGIDVQHYEIHDAWSFRHRRITGWTRVTLRATETLSGFDLDFLLPVREVAVDGAPAAWSRPDAHELRVEAPVRAGTTYDVRVSYAGRPGEQEWDGERNWLAGGREVVAMNQPHMAPWWFPSNDHPLDKALMDIHVTAPRGMQVVANGRQVSVDVGRHRVTAHWRADEPMVPYLAFFAVGRFEVRRGTDHGLPWLVAVSRSIPSATRDRSLRLMERTPRLVHWLQGELGRYPFSTVGGLTTSLSPGFALENQTRPTYPVLGGGGVRTVVHELAHQWLGDSVAVAGWRDIWLNEGAATFMELRYAETHGREPALAWLRRTYDDYSADSWFWDRDIADPGPDHLFDWEVYDRGAMTLEALRNRVGERDFWRILRRWVDVRSGGNGSTEEFVALAERVSGEGLAGFFRAWLSAGTKPARTAANGLT